MYFTFFFPSVSALRTSSHTVKPTALMRFYGYVSALSTWKGRGLGLIQKKSAGTWKMNVH